jgi:hypothetical protein
MPPLRCVVVACLVFVLLVLAVALPSLWELALGWVLAIAVVTALPVALMAGLLAWIPSMPLPAPHEEEHWYGPVPPPLRPKHAREGDTHG